jgi:hypothetical protein
MKTFKEFLNEAKLKPGDGVRTSDGSDGIVYKILATGDLAVVITGWDNFGDKNESSRPNTSIEDISDLTPKTVNKKYNIYYEKSKNMKL